MSEPQFVLQREPYAGALREDMRPIWRTEHYDELAPFPAQTSRDLDEQQLLTLEAAGALHCLTIRTREEGALVGYYLSVVAPFLNSLGVKLASTNLYYIRPQYRHQGLGRRLFAEWEARMRALGVDLLATVTKQYSSHAKMLETMGFRANELAYLKWIGPEPEKE